MFLSFIIFNIFYILCQFKISVVNHCVFWIIITGYFHIAVILYGNMKSSIKGKPVWMVLFMIDLMVYMCKKIIYKFVDTYEMVLLEQYENCKNKNWRI